MKIHRKYNGKYIYSSEDLYLYMSERAKKYYSQADISLWQDDNGTIYEFDGDNATRGAMLMMYEDVDALNTEFESRLSD